MSAVPRVRRSGPTLGVVAILCLSFTAMSGCGSGQKVLDINDDAQFQSVVGQTSKPVLVMFYKSGCPACAASEGVLDQLATEYEGRAVVARFLLLTFFSKVTSPELKERFGVWLVPHVVLLVNDHESNHWVGFKGADVYRKALDDALARPGPSAAASTGGNGV